MNEIRYHRPACIHCHLRLKQTGRVKCPSCRKWTYIVKTAFGDYILSEYDPDNIDYGVEDND